MATERQKFGVGRLLLIVSTGFILGLTVVNSIILSLRWRRRHGSGRWFPPRWAVRRQGEYLTRRASAIRYTRQAQSSPENSGNGVISPLKTYDHSARSVSGRVSTMSDRARDTTNETLARIKEKYAHIKEKYWEERLGR